MMKPAGQAATDPVSFGQELRRLRESAGLVLEDISAETKVSVRVLRALEEGTFQYLPERVFARNFVRQYARIIGFDEDRLAGWFDTAWERFLSDSGSHPVVLELPKAPQRTFRWWVWLPLFLIGVVVIVAAWAIIHQKTPSVVPARRTTGAAPAVRPTATIPPARSVPAASPVAAGGAGVEATFSVQVKPGRECWIRYRDATGKNEQQLLHEGQNLRISAPAPLTLTVGNAAGVALTVGAKTYDDLGRPGEVLDLEIGADGTMKVLRATGQHG